MRLVATKWVDRDSGLSVEERSCGNGFRKFAVVDESGRVLSKGLEFEQEPSPSNRDDDFLSRCRFDSFEDAANAMQKITKT